MSLFKTKEKPYDYIPWWEKVFSSKYSVIGVFFYIGFLTFFFYSVYKMISLQLIAQTI